jgi:hypothetical protein
VVTGGRPGLLTPETCAITGAGLVLCSFLSGAPLQLLQLGVYQANFRTSDPAFLWLIVPAALLSLGGMVLGARARRDRLGPGMAGLSGAALIIGAILILIYALAYVRLLAD